MFIGVFSSKIEFKCSLSFWKSNDVMVYNMADKNKLRSSSSFEPDVVCSVFFISQHRSCSVCMSFARLGHHNGYTA